MQIKQIAGLIDIRVKKFVKFGNDENPISPCNNRESYLLRRKNKPRSRSFRKIGKKENKRIPESSFRSSDLQISKTICRFNLRFPTAAYYHQVRDPSK